MKKYMYLSILTFLMNSYSFMEAVHIYIKNDTDKTIKFAKNERSVMMYNVKPRSEVFTDTAGLKSLYAKYENDTVSRQLDVSKALQDAANGVSSVVHIVPGTLYGVKVGSVEAKKGNY